jgi:S1-C subfamily serine protease
MYALVGKLDKEPKLSFTKTKEVQARNTSFKVTLGIMPDYLFEGKGVKVDGTTDGKPAAVAGVKRGDILIQLDQYPINGMEDYMQTLGKLEKGLKTQLKILRDGKEQILEVQF